MGTSYDNDPPLPVTSQNLHGEEDLALDQRPVQGRPGVDPQQHRGDLELGVDLDRDLQLEFGGKILSTIDSHKTTQSSSSTSPITSPKILDHQENLGPRFRGEVLISAASSTTNHSTLLSPLQLSTSASSPTPATTSPTKSPSGFSCDQCGKLFPKRCLLKYVAQPNHPSLLQVRITKPPALAAISNLMRNHSTAPKPGVWSDSGIAKTSPATSGRRSTLTRDRI